MRACQTKNNECEKEKRESIKQRQYMVLLLRSSAVKEGSNFFKNSGKGQRASRACLPYYACGVVHAAREGAVYATLRPARVPGEKTAFSTATRHASHLRGCDSSLAVHGSSSSTITPTAAAMASDFLKRKQRARRNGYHLRLMPPFLRSFISGSCWFLRSHLPAATVRQLMAPRQAHAPRQGTRV